MCVKIYVDFEVAVLFGTLGHCNFGSPDGRLLFAIRLLVETIQVLAKGVQAVIASRHSIRVQSRYDLKNKVFTKLLALFRFQVSYQTNSSI